MLSCRKRRSLRVLYGFSGCQRCRFSTCGEETAAPGENGTSNRWDVAGTNRRHLCPRALPGHSGVVSKGDQRTVAKMAVDCRWQCARTYDTTPRAERVVSWEDAADCTGGTDQTRLQSATACSDRLRSEGVATKNTKFNVSTLQRFASKHFNIFRSQEIQTTLETFAKRRKR